MNAPGEMVRTATTERSRTVIAICVLILIQIYRIAAFSTAQAADTGAAPGPWFFPALADVAFGITAPFMALALWRMVGLGVWVVGIVWLSLSFFDYVDGLTTVIRFGSPSPAQMPNAVAIVWFLGWLTVVGIALALLTGARGRSHFPEGR